MKLATRLLVDVFGLQSLPAIFTPNPVSVGPIRALNGELKVRQFFSMAASKYK